MVMVGETSQRFAVRPESAKAVMVAAGAAVKGISGIDAVLVDREAAREDAESRPGYPPLPEPSEELLTARAVREAALEQARALRRDLADLLADAESVWLADRPAIPFVSVEPHDIPPAPRLLGGIELEPFDVLRYTVELEAWFARQLGSQLRAVSTAAQELVGLLDSADRPSAELRDRLEAFVRRLRRPESQP
jgi:hypothetical protein